MPSFSIIFLILSFALSSLSLFFVSYKQVLLLLHSVSPCFFVLRSLSFFIFKKSNSFSEKSKSLYVYRSSYLWIKKYDFYYFTFTWIDKIQFHSQQRGLSLSDGNFETSFLQLTKNSRNHFVISNSNQLYL